MRRQDAEADARRAPAGRGPGWPESMRRQEAEAEADARRAPAGRGPGWPESMRRQEAEADARRGARRARAQDGRASTIVARGYFGRCTRLEVKRRLGCPHSSGLVHR